MKNINKFLTAQDMTDYPAVCNGGSGGAGFNRRVYGSTYLEAFQYPHEFQDVYLNAGYRLADKLIDQGKIYYVHNFHHLDCRRGGYAFQYGGFWVCNDCGGSNLENEKWKIKVFKDGNNYCCVGLGFENLQESSNYGFGDTKEDAIKDYWKNVN